jgi:DNA-binding response OmpR family regulator
MNDKAIFVAEDNTLVRIYLIRILLKKGFKNISIFDDAEEMFVTASTKPPDLIVADIMLKNDTDATITAEKLWQKNQVPFIFVSGADFHSFKNKFTDNNCEFIKKPFKEDELVKAINKLLKSD